MKFQPATLLLTTVVAPVVWAATCQFEVWTSHTQGIGIPGGYQTGVSVTYGDGTSEHWETDQGPPYDNKCFVSQLPYTVCVSSDLYLKQGGMAYSDQWMAFGEDACQGVHDSDPFSSFVDQLCSFECS